MLVLALVLLAVARLRRIVVGVDVAHLQRLGSAIPRLIRTLVALLLLLLEPRKIAAMLSRLRITPKPPAELPESIFW